MRSTDQMPLLAEKEIDYAFFCCDSVYNMGLEEAAKCAEMVGAKHNIPCHMTTTTTGRAYLAFYWSCQKRISAAHKVPEMLIKNGHFRERFKDIFHLAGI